MSFRKVNFNNVFFPPNLIFGIYLQVVRPYFVNCQFIIHTTCTAYFPTGLSVIHSLYMVFMFTQSSGLNLLFIGKNPELLQDRNNAGPRDSQPCQNYQQPMAGVLYFV